MLLIRRADAPEEEAEDLQNHFIRFEEGEVVLDGKLGAPFDDLLVVRFTPMAADGTIQVDPREANIGPVDVPVQFLKRDIVSETEILPCVLVLSPRINPLAD